MSLATLMVHVDLDGASDARVRLAAGLAGRLNSRLIGVAGWAPLPPPVEDGDITVGERWEDQIREITAALAQCGERFRAAVGSTGSPPEWRASADLASPVVAQEARAADLVILGRDVAPAGSGRSLDPGSTILRLGRPALVVPPEVDTLWAEHIVLAWKDTREARRATRDALPLLQQARRVTIAEICPDDMPDDARRRVEDVADYLLRHGVRLGGSIVRDSQGAIAHDLVRIADDEGADLIVAGAYGHSRLGEWIFGGVTRDLLASSPVCCLLSH